MKKRSKVFLTVVSLFTMVLTLLPVSVMAESLTYRSGEKGKITINYYDDNLRTKPTVDSHWRLYKVGDVTYSYNETNVDALTITSLIGGLDISRETKAEEVLNKLEYKVISESKIEMTGKDVNGQKLVYFDGVTNEDGVIEYKDLEQGVYLGVETQVARYHNRSTPFLISIPNTDETGRISSLEAKIEPKAVLAGDLVISKQLHGNAAEIAYQWTMELTLPEGTYHYKTNEMKKYGNTYSKGQEGYCKSGDKIKIYAGEALTIYDIPSGKEYSISEIEANAQGYQTRYERKDGIIEAYKPISVVVHNTKNKDVKTDAGANTMLYTGVGVAAGALLIVILVCKNKRKENEENKEEK